MFYDDEKIGVDDYANQVEVHNEIVSVKADAHDDVSYGVQYEDNVISGNLDASKETHE